MTDLHLKELLKEVRQLRVEECSKDDILDLLERLMLFSDQLVNRIHILENKIQTLEQRQDTLIDENERLLAGLDMVIARANENPQEAFNIFMQLIREKADKKPGLIN